MKPTVERLLQVLDIAASPVTLLTALWMKCIRRIGVQRMRASRNIFSRIGVMPVREHYYEPMTNPAKHLLRSLREERTLSGLDMNEAGQLAILAGFHYQNELKDIASNAEKSGFRFDNGFFESGDAEYLYNMIRCYKPRRIFEIGSGHSTRIARIAIAKNSTEMPGYRCRHVCIEPYEQPELGSMGVEVIRRRVETLPSGFFCELAENDILFIDSSHVIRPQGDVLYEFLELLGNLAKGVIIHVHDIFTPRDYLDCTLIEERRFWNEQYILEAFLLFNHQFSVIGALNWLWHNHREEIISKCPILAQQVWREPGSFWIRRTGAMHRLASTS